MSFSGHESAEGFRCVRRKAVVAEKCRWSLSAESNIT